LYNVPSWVQVFGSWEGEFNLTSLNFGSHFTFEAPLVPTPIGKFSYYPIEDLKVNYKAPWPYGAVGTGANLVRLNYSIYANEPTNWRISQVPGFYEPAPNDGWVCENMNLFYLTIW